MANFQVPQFIEQKPRIIGPLTLKQFSYVAVAAVLSFIAFRLFNFVLWFVVSFFLAIISLCLAFVKINGQELPSIFISAFYYFWKPRAYTWKRPEAKETFNTTSLEKLEDLRKKAGFQQKLKSVALKIATLKTPFLKNAQGAKSSGYQTVTFLTGEKRVAKKVDY